MTEKLMESEINRLREVVGFTSLSKEDQIAKIPEITDEGVKKSQDTPDSSLSEPEEVPGKKEDADSPAPKTHDMDLFVKIDEHSAVASELLNAKKDIKSVVDTISLLAKAEKLKAEAIEGMEESLNKLDTKLENVESKLIAPGEMAIPGLEDFEMDLDDNLSHLHTELESLKAELSKIK